jgi:hypothetical protein
VKIIALAADYDGCFQYRVRLPAEAAQRQGIDIAYAHDIDVEATMNSKSGVTTVTEVRTDATLVTMQRPLTQRLHALAEACHRQGIKVMVDIDDDLSNLPRHNSAYKRVDPLRQPLHNYVWLEKIAAMADRVTVSTPALLRYASHGHGAVVYNAVDAAWLTIPPALPNAIGWTGSMRTHGFDLKAVRGGLAPLSKDCTLHLISDEPLQITNELRWTGRVGSSPWQDFTTYPHEISVRIGVGIVPLDTNDIFNDAKSFLKGLEFAALGIPFVASPSPQYQLLANGYRIGTLAKSPGTWERRVRETMHNRERIGAAYRERVAAEFTTDHTVKDWIAAWEQA